VLQYRGNEVTHQHDLCHQRRCKELRWYGTCTQKIATLYDRALVPFVCILRCHLCRSEAIRTKMIQVYNMHAKGRPPSPVSMLACRNSPTRAGKLATRTGTEPVKELPVHNSLSMRQKVFSALLYSQVACRKYPAG